MKTNASAQNRNRLDTSTQSLNKYFIEHLPSARNCHRCRVRQCIDSTELFMLVKH